jgi:predicted metal-binding protein
MTIQLHICETCRGADIRAGWDRLRAALASGDLVGQVEIKAQSCMNGCARPVSMALQSPGRATYFFAGVDPEGDCADVVATVRAYLAAPGGWIEDARPCGRLRQCLVGRVPAI